MNRCLLVSNIPRILNNYFVLDLKHMYFLFSHYLVMNKFYNLFNQIILVNIFNIKINIFEVRSYID